MKKKFINLSNGIEAFEKENFSTDDICFIRIQSSHCESHQYDRILYELDSNFLMFLALGYECEIYDYGGGTDTSKAIYAGLEWIRYVLCKRWFGKEITPVIKNKNVKNFFDKKYSEIEKITRKKLDYYKKFLLADELKLTGFSGYADMDNRPDLLKEILKKKFG